MERLLIFLFLRVNFRLNPGLQVIIRKAELGSLVRKLRFVNGSTVFFVNSHYWSLIKDNISWLKKKSKTK